MRNLELTTSYTVSTILIIRTPIGMSLLLPTGRKMEAADTSAAELLEITTGPVGRRVAIPCLLPAPAALVSPTDSLCDVCKAIELRPERFVVLPGDGEEAGNLAHPDIPLGLVENILKRPHCPLCRLIVFAIGGPGVPLAEDGEPVCVEMSWITEGRPPSINELHARIPEIRLLVLVAKRRGGGHVFSERFKIFPKITLLANDAPTPSKAFFVRRIREVQIDFRMVQNWISMCETWHGPACNKPKTVDHEIQNIMDEIPSFRLIDVHKNCIIRGLSNTRYVALSYVWGGVEVTQSLTRCSRKNVAALEQPGALVQMEFYEGIPWTIRDAMEVVRKLGLRYLWVDSLCIVQDDDTGEKADVISKMELVYGAAFLTIIAATGLDANAGLPGVRPGTRGQRQAIEEILPGLRLASKESYYHYINGSVYYTRAWTYQEQQFTKRSLIFTGGQVVFRCLIANEWREDVVCEDEGIVTGRRGDAKPEDIGEFEALIHSYTRRSLTYDSDIYNAFGGFAGYIKRELNASLCHGIPDEFFDWFLLWEPMEHQVRRKGAPSWSWSGWIGGSLPRVMNRYGGNIYQIRKEQKKRTWIIWHQRVVHDSTECALVWAPGERTSSGPANFYGANILDRFPFDCSSTAPTHRALAGAPKYYADTLNPNPGSGLLQFWTVSVKFSLKAPIFRVEMGGPDNRLPLARFFGRDGYEVGYTFVSENWWDSHVPGAYEFILLCEGRGNEQESKGKEGEDGWKYAVMLIEWHGEWAERVAVGSIEKHDLSQALEPGPVWKEIILG